jgi:L-iditol 2-dehydrogenase
MHLQLAINDGAAQVVVIDLKDGRLELACELGATRVINPTTKDPAAVVNELTAGRGADVVIETAGVPEVWKMALALARKGATVVMFGGCPSGTQISLDTGMVHYGELTVKGVFHHTPRTVEKALHLLSEGVVRGGPLINARVPLQQVEQALEVVMQGDAVKVAVIP